MHKVENQQIGKEWRENPMSKLSWQKSPNQAGGCAGEAGGYFVYADGFSRRGYLKPIRPHANALTFARAAREKIAADFAYDLALPVPPAQLSVRENPPDGCESAVVVSLVMYPVQHPWGVVRASVEDGHEPENLAMAKALSACGPMLAFDTWIDQKDHGDHPNNVVWGYDRKRPQESELIFLDFAFSLGYDGGWDKGGWNHKRIAPFPPRMAQFANNDEILQKARDIEALCESDIREIVERIPESHLSLEQKRTIMEGLIGRKAELVKNLTAALGS